MRKDLSQWRGCRRPNRTVFEGRFVRLEPLNAEKHGDDLFQVFAEPGAEERMRYIVDKPDTRDNFQTLLQQYQISEDPIYFATIDKASGKAVARQAFMEIDPIHGRCELGRVYRGRNYTRGPGSTEATYLFLRYLFDDLGYRRVVWRCDNGNADSRRATLRLGFTFEVVFRQHKVLKGFNQDNAFFSMIDLEWPSRKAAFEKWLHPDNFDAKGLQKLRLEECRVLAHF